MLKIYLFIFSILLSKRLCSTISFLTDHGQASTLKKGQSRLGCSSTRRPILDMPIGSGIGCT